jgi:putative membrane protein
MGMHWAWLIFVGTLIVLIWAFWIAFAEQGVTHRQEAPREGPEEALRKRFAQGEISEEQFAETLRVLRESRQTVDPNTGSGGSRG